MLYPIHMAIGNSGRQRVKLFYRIVSYRFYPRDAMLARVIEIATCLSVRLSVCPSRAGIVSKRRKLAA